MGIRERARAVTGREADKEWLSRGVTKPHEGGGTATGLVTPGLSHANGRGLPMASARRDQATARAGTSHGSATPGPNQRKEMTSKGVTPPPIHHSPRHPKRTENITIKKVNGFGHKQNYSSSHTIRTIQFAKVHS